MKSQVRQERFRCVSATDLNQGAAQTLTIGLGNYPSSFTNSANTGRSLDACAMLAQDRRR